MEDSGSRYADMLRLPHHVSRTRPRMPLAERAAQFSPFAALSGYEDAIQEAGRLTEDFRELDETAAEELDRKLQYLLPRLSRHPEITVTFFQPDPRRSGGAWVQTEGRAVKADLTEGFLYLEGQERIPLSAVSGLSGSFFDPLETW